MTAHLANAKQHTVSPNVLVLVSGDEALTDSQQATLESIRNAVRQLVPPVYLDVTLRWTHRPIQMLQHRGQGIDDHRKHYETLKHE